MIAGRYSLKAEIGRGGMGIVWRGEDELLGRDVALKQVGMIPGGATPDLARAEREARLAASLNHPHVVSVFDLVDEADGQWLVMEYVESTTLAELVRDNGPLHPDEAARILWQAADALAAAHAAGIVHRDVKPSNILVTPTGQAKLTDFGIARASADATLTQTGLVTGSPAYLSPEVATGGTATPASDVWALGATLFHTLTGTPPYDAQGNVMGALYQIVHEEPPRPPNAGWLLPLLEHTMTRDAQDRWSMEQVRSFLAGDAALEPETVAIEAQAGGLDEPTRIMTLPPAPPLQRTVPPRPDTRGGRGKRTAGVAAGVVAAVVVGVVAVVAALLVGWSLIGQDPRTDRTTGNRPSSSAGTGSSPSARPTATGMRSFVQDYLATVTKDPAAAWGRLTPQFQDRSGDFGGYRSFWSTIESATPGTISADPSAGTVSYTVTYRKTDGTTVSGDVSLDLVMRNGDYLIAGEH